MSVSTDVLSRVGMPSGDHVEIIRRRFRAGEGPRVAIVAGIRGDAPEGVRVAHEVAQVLERFHEELQGIVDIYPCVNPLAAHRGIRHWPFFDVDLNRRFPGRADGHAPDVVAWDLVQDLQGADQVIELRGAHPAFSEAPQAHVRRGQDKAIALAGHTNVEVVWARSPGPEAPSTFAAQFSGTIALEGGTGNRLSPGVGRSLGEGVLNLLNVLRVLPDDKLPFHWAAVARPAVVDDRAVLRVRASRAGLFLPEHGAWAEVDVDTVLGTVVEPRTGELLETLTAPSAGRLLAVREHPVVFPGTMVARVVEVERG